MSYLPPSDLSGDPSPAPPEVPPSSTNLPHPSQSTHVNPVNEKLPSQDSTAKRSVAKRNWDDDGAHHSQVESQNVLSYPQSTRANPSGPPTYALSLQRRLQSFAAVLHRIHLLFSSPTSTDRILCTISYTLKLLSAFLSSLLSRRVGSFSSALVLTEKVTAGAAAPTHDSLFIKVTELDPRWLKLGDWATRMRNLDGLVADYRVFARLWGLIGISEWAVGHWRTGLALSNEQKAARERGSNSIILEDGETRLKPSADPFTRKLVWAQIAVNIGYQALENGAYLAQHNVLSWTPEKQSRAWVWSARCWAGHVALDFIRLWREAALSRKLDAHREWTRHRQLRLQESEKGKVDGVSEEHKDRLKLSAQEVEAAGADAAAAWYRSLVLNFSYAPLTMHYSFQNGVFVNPWIDLFAILSGGLALADSWRKTAGK